RPGRDDGDRRPRPARPRARPPPARTARGDGDALLPRPASHRGGRDPRHPRRDHEVPAAPRARDAPGGHGRRAARALQRGPGASGMNTRMPLERSIAAWMADEGQAARDDRALDQILRTTAHARPQPRWAALIKEPPMHRNTRVAVGSPTVRLALVAALLVLVLAAGAAAAAAILRTPPDDDWLGFRGGADHAGIALQGPVGRPV